MRETLAGFRRNRREDAYAIMIKDTEGTLVGWSLTWKYVKPSRTGPTGSTYIYVRRNMRRHKYGSRLLKWAEKEAGKVRVYPHDKRSTAFFERYKDRVALTPYS